MTFIASTALITNTNTVTFSSIGSQFTHLQLRCFTRDSNSSTSNSTMYVSLNGDTSAAYPYHYLWGNGASPASAGVTAQTLAVVGFPASNGVTSSVFGSSIIDILDYTNTSKNKTVRALTGFDSNGNGNVGLFSAVWLNTAAVTSITVWPAVQPFLAGSRFDLYGITVSPLTGA